MPVSSKVIALGLIAAVQRDTCVWVRRAMSAVAWSRCHFVCHWLQDLSLEKLGTLQRSICAHRSTHVSWPPLGAGGRYSFHTRGKMSSLDRWVCRSGARLELRDETHLAYA